jgi:adenylate cyclase
MEHGMIGSIINERYRLDEELGQGGMGTVYRGFDLQLDRKVAIKFLRQDIFNEKERGRFHHEAKIIAKLKHPNIIEIYDVGKYKGAPYFVMELVEGSSLQALRFDDLDQILDICVQICQSLENAHQNGIVHRDLKPENVLIDNMGRVKLADFGIARSEVSNFTTVGEIVGTVNYLAPELATGGQVDGRTDLYSLGVILYELTTGRLPFVAENPAAVITKHLFEKPVPAIELNPSLQPGLSYLIDCLLSKTPEGRPESADEVRQFLLTCNADLFDTSRERTYPTPAEIKLPPSLVEEREEPDQAFEVFVGRERELKLLNEYLDKARRGEAQIVFVTGGPGRGKTALVQAFAQQAQAADPDLLFVRGTCNAFSGVGDAYLPFREIFTLLAGEVKIRQRPGSVTRQQALRLWHAFPTLVEALLSRGNDLVNTMVSGETLLSQATIAFPERIDLLGKLSALVDRRADFESGLEQNMLFEQCVNVLEMLSQKQTLILLLDDLQWVDTASVSLLFYLGRRMTGNQVLIIGTYRPHEVSQGRGEEKHPLAGLLSEMKRIYGEIQIDLRETAPAEGRDFIEKYIDSEPNLLDEQFRKKLFERTQGHPLFTIELLRTLQEKGCLGKDETGHWVQGVDLNWNLLPARVEGVIEERIAKLEHDSKDILCVASVEGEVFTAQVIARVQDIKERVLCQQLSEVLEKRHRLVKEHGEESNNGNVLSYYQFSHNLYQRYMYDNLGKSERRLLHGEIGMAIEDLFIKQENQIEPLAYHFLQARNWEKAWYYQVEAGKKAQYRFASQEAIVFYKCGLDISRQLPGLGTNEIAEVHILIADVHSSINEYEQALAELALALTIISQEANSSSKGLLMARIYHKMGHVLRNDGKYPEAIEVIQRGIDNLADGQPRERGALQIAMASALTRQGELESAQDWCQEGMENAKNGGDLEELAHAYSLLGTIRRDLGDTESSLNNRLKSLELSEEIGSIPLKMEAHNNLAVAYYDLGQLEKAVGHYNQSRDLSQRMGNLNTTARAEINLGEVQLIRGDWEEAERGFRQALNIWEGTGYLLGQAYGSCNMGAVLTREGEVNEALQFLGFSEETFNKLGAQSFLPSVYRRQAAAYLALREISRAEELAERSLRIAEKLFMRQEEGAALRVLGMIYHEKGENQRAIDKLEQSLSIFQEAGVQYEKARCNFVLARLWFDEIEFEPASKYLESAIKTFEILGAMADLKQCLALKAEIP